MSAVLSERFVAQVLAIRLAPPPQPLAAAGEVPELIARALRGERKAFDAIYRLHADAVYRRLSRLVGPDPEREDLVQQVFVDVFRGLPSFRGDAAFSTWLYRIVVHVAYEHLRRRRRRPASPATLEAIAELVDGALSPEAAARQRQELERALGYLGKLDPKKRIAFVLRVVEGLSLDEIGELVGAKAPAVGQRVKYAQRELDAMIARDELRRAREEAR